MEEQIRQTTKTRGWEHIREMFLEETQANLKAIDTRQPNESIATQYIGKLEAERIVNSVLDKIEKIAYEQEKTTISYK